MPPNIPEPDGQPNPERTPRFSPNFLYFADRYIIMIVADFAMVPMGATTSASRYIKAVYDVLKESGVNFVPGPMSTTVETRTMEELFDLIEKANIRIAEMGIQRIITSIRIDYRLDKEISIESKMKASGIVIGVSSE
jgi:uncharacterized protein (TIGR00106 family)